jgi:TolB-like protein
VHPIADLSASQNLDRFCSGLTREIVRRLASVKGLRVATSHTAAGSAAAMAVEGSISQAVEGFG